MNISKHWKRGRRKNTTVPSTPGQTPLVSGVSLRIETGSDISLCHCPASVQNLPSGFSMRLANPLGFGWELKNCSKCGGWVVNVLTGSAAPSGKKKGK